MQIKVFVCVTSRAEDSKLGKWWNGRRSTCSDVADGAIEQGYGSKRGSIPEGRREVASLVVIVLHTHYDSELGDRGHPARALDLKKTASLSLLTGGHRSAGEEKDVQH